MGYTPDVGTASVFSTLVLHGAIGLLAFILFEVFRPLKEIYAPRYRTKKDRCPPISTGFASWVLPLWRMSEEETLRVVGLDGYVVLRFLLLCARVGMVGGLVGLVVLLPVYSTSAGVEDVIGMNLHTMANVKAQSPRLWGPFFCMYLFSGAFLYLLHKEYEYFVTLRQQFLSEGDPDVPAQQLMSVIVENVPEEYRRSHLLKELFESLFPGEVAHAQIAVKYGPVLDLVSERKIVLAKLEKAVALFEASDKSERPVVRVGDDNKLSALSCKGEEMDAIDYYQGELRRLNAEVEENKRMIVQLTHSDISSFPSDSEVRNGLKPDSNGVELTTKLSTTENAFVMQPEDMTCTGFVTFNSRRAQAAACQLTMLSKQFPSLKSFPAESPSGIVWPNISNSLSFVKLRSKLTSYLLSSGILFWASVLSFIAFISQLSTLEKFLPFLKSLDTVSYSLLQGQLPVLALIVFMALLPLIFTSIATKVDGRKTLSDIRSQVFDWFFFYQLANVYLLLLAGSVFGALTEVLDNPISVVSILANALPTVSTFFINFMLTALLSGVPLFLLRIGPMVIYNLFLFVLDSRKLTRRDLLEGPLANVGVKYEVVVPKLLYLVAIQQTFMVISPILFIISGLLFSALFLAWKYHLSFVSAPPSQLGGIFWYKMYRYAMMSLLASSLTMIGYMGIKEGFVQSGLLIPLPFIIRQVWTYTNDKFESISLDMAHSEAVAADAREDNLSSNALAASFSPNFFVPKELSYENPMEYSTPVVYRLSNAPLIEKETKSLCSSYHKPTFANEFDALSTKDDQFCQI